MEAGCERASLARGNARSAFVERGLAMQSTKLPVLALLLGLGDLFVARVAGNVVDDHALGSIEYAVEHLGTRLIVVLGHERCGAVQAALQGGKLPGHVGFLVKAIRPAVERGA